MDAIRKVANRNYLPLLIFSMFALTFGYWFTLNQVSAISASAFVSYPWQFFLLTILRCYLTLFIFFLLSVLVFSNLTFKEANFHKNVFLFIALSYCPLMFVFLNTPLIHIASYILLMQLGLFLYVNRKNISTIGRKLFLDTLALLLFFGLHFFFTTRFSPLFWKSAILNMVGFSNEGMQVVNPIFNSFLQAKQFSFTNIDYSQWAGILHPSINFNSPFMQLFAFIFDMPSVSYQAFHVALMIIFFTLMVIGSFGLYLFFRYATKVHWLFALLGGALFFFSGDPILDNSFIEDNGIFLSPLALFPYALLMLSLAFKKNDYIYALWAGVALAAQFFFFTPHPEGTIYSCGFFMIYAFGLGLFTDEIPAKQKFILITTSLLAFFVLSAFLVIPILADRLFGEMYVFAHIGDILPLPLRTFHFYIAQVFVSGCVSYYLLLKQKRLSPEYKSVLLFAGSVFFIILLATNVHLLHGIVHVLHVGIHFWLSSRLGAYLYLASLIIFTYALDAMAVSAQPLLMRLLRDRCKYGSESAACI